MDRLTTSGQWSSGQAWAWYNRQPWLVGCNYLPSTSVNDIEMWQRDTFDPLTIDRELGWAHKLGFNTVRVFLNYVVWKSDSEGLKERVSRFLELANKHQLSVMPVLFDDCNFGLRVAASGPQPEPVSGVHNSQWVSSPALAMVTDPAAWNDLEQYTRDIIGAFGHDSRVVIWDLYNEPGNSKMGEKSLPLAEAAFAWARAIRPEQPLTCGAWSDFNSSMSQRLMEMSDVVSFHGYEGLSHVEEKLAICRRHSRPVICTEWLHRPADNTVETILPFFRAQRVGCWNWGLVYGRTQTYMPWGSKAGDSVPRLWQHDLLHADGRPFRSEEVDAILDQVNAARADASSGESR